MTRWSDPDPVASGSFWALEAQAWPQGTWLLCRVLGLRPGSSRGPKASCSVSALGSGWAAMQPAGALRTVGPPPQCSPLFESRWSLSRGPWEAGGQGLACRPRPSSPHGVSAGLAVQLRPPCVPCRWRWKGQSLRQTQQPESQVPGPGPGVRGPAALGLLGALGGGLQPPDAADQPRVGGPALVCRWVAGRGPGRLPSHMSHARRLPGHQPVGSTESGLC